MQDTLLEKSFKQYKLGSNRQGDIWISVAVTSWRRESSNISFIILDKLLYYSRNLSFWKKYKIKDRWTDTTDRQTDGPTDQVTDGQTAPTYSFSFAETKNLC